MGDKGYVVNVRPVFARSRCFSVFYFLVSQYSVFFVFHSILFPFCFTVFCFLCVSQYFVSFAFHSILFPLCFTVFCLLCVSQYSVSFVFHCILFPCVSPYSVSLCFAVFCFLKFLSLFFTGRMTIIAMLRDVPSLTVYFSNGNAYH